MITAFSRPQTDESLENLERENLAVHAELSIHRYRAHEQRFEELEDEIKKLKQENKADNKFMARILTIATIVLTVAATVSVITLDRMR
jgi:hypothetical protein